MPIKGTKITGIRLINYHEAGINLKDHGNKVLDFWILFKAKDYGFTPNSLKDFRYMDKLPNSAREAYEEWFKNFDWNNENDKDWIQWLQGRLNFFYKTHTPTEMPEDTWYIYLTKAEEDAREIAENQVFHGNPEIDCFWQVDTNTKSAEVSGRRNGQVFSSELDKIVPPDTKGFYWAVAFQAPESVKLFYQDGDKEKSKIISWAAECKNITLLQITSNGRFIVKQVFIKGKAGKQDKNVPSENVPTQAYMGFALAQYFKKYYYELFGLVEEIEEEVKTLKIASNERKNALGTFNDNEINVGKLIKDINKFIEYGNVPKERVEENKRIRRNIKKKNVGREREIRAKVREAKKYLRKKEKKSRQKLNPLLHRK